MIFVLLSLHLIFDCLDEVLNFLVSIVVVHPAVVHDRVVAAEDVEAEPVRRAVPVVQGTGEQPRGGTQ